MHESYLRQTFKIAEQSVQAGNHPFGSLLVLDGKVVAEAGNSVITESDVTRHAELVLISKFAHRFTDEERKRMIVYASTEPCAMCTGAIIWSGIETIVFACSGKKLEEIAKGGFYLESREILKHSTKSYSVTGPLLEEEASQQHLNYW